MTASNRLSFLTARESSYGSGSETRIWIAPPPGSYISTTHNRETTRVNAAGTKKWDTIAYGKVAGSWTWNFMLDYKYLEPLWYVFEDYDCDEGTGSAPNEHIFKKKNGGRVPSFTIRRVILNEMAGGPEGSDEIIELTGCVCRNITFSKSAGPSQIAVTMTGFYADEHLVKTSLDSTDYQEYDGKIVEYMCMFMGQKDDGDEDDIVDGDHYVAYTDSLSVQIGNSADPVYSTCSAIAVNYYEGLTNNEFTTSCYSTDPAIYKQRVYSGGEDNTADHPLRKGLKPVRKIVLSSYDKSMVDDAYESIEEAITSSEYRVRFDITDCVIKSLTWPKADASIIQDNISSAACKDIFLTIVSDAEDLGNDGSEDFPENQVTVTSYIVLDANGGTLGTSGEKKTIEAGTAPTVPTFSGHTFGGYYTDRVGGKQVILANGTYKTNVEKYTGATATDWIRTSNCTLYAHWA